MGTSLTVHPFASLVDLVPDDCPRVLINLVEVGDFDRRDDVVLLGKCDEIVQELCRELGWEEELQKAWTATADSVEVDVKPAAAKRDIKAGASEELDRITRDIEKSLTISRGSSPDSETEEIQGPKKCVGGEADEKEAEADPSVSADGKT